MSAKIQCNNVFGAPISVSEGASLIANEAVASVQIAGSAMSAIGKLGWNIGANSVGMLTYLSGAAVSTVGDLSGLTSIGLGMVKNGLNVADATLNAAGTTIKAVGTGLMQTATAVARL